MYHNSQKGVSVIISFFIMTIMLAIILSISTILSNEIKALGSIGNSISSFFAADSGIEKTLYFDRKQLVGGANRGVCNLCDACSNLSTDPDTQCNICMATPLVASGCAVDDCTNCEIPYESAFGGRTYTVDATVTTVESVSNFLIHSKGLYQDLVRQIELNSD